MSIDSHDFNNFTTTDWHDLLSNTIDYRDFITLVRIRNMKNRIDELENERKRNPLPLGMGSSEHPEGL